MPLRRQCMPHGRGRYLMLIAVVWRYDVRSSRGRDGAPEVHPVQHRQLSTGPSRAKFVDHRLAEPSAAVHALLSW